MNPYFLIHIRWNLFNIGKILEILLFEGMERTDTEATANIIKEIGVRDVIVDMIEKKQFINNINTYHDDNYAIKICAYADQRVSPNGVLSLENRLNEAIVRYRGSKKC